MDPQYKIKPNIHPAIILRAMKAIASICTLKNAERLDNLTLAVLKNIKGGRDIRVAKMTD
jgi:hypothetical protein